MGEKPMPDGAPHPPGINRGVLPWLATSLACIRGTTGWNGQACRGARMESQAVGVGPKGDGWLEQHATPAPGGGRGTGMTP